MKMIGASQKSPCKSANAGVNYDLGSSHNNTKNFPRSRSLRDAGGEEDVYEAEFSGPTERAASRASSRSKSRIAKDARAELLGLNDVLCKVVRRRESRSQSASRVREGLDIEIDPTENENAFIEVSKSVSSSRVGNRSSKYKSDLVAMGEALQDSWEREPRSARASRLLKVSSDAPENDGILYTARSASRLSAVIPSSRSTTPRASSRSLRDQEGSRDSPDEPVRQELRSPNLVRQSSVHDLDHDDDGTLEHWNRVSYRTPAKGLRSSRESSDTPEERLLSVERHAVKQERSPRKTIEIADRQMELTLSHAERAPGGNVTKVDLDSPEKYTDCTGLHRRTRIARPSKKKVRDIPKDPASFLPVSQPPECLMTVVHPVDYADPPLLPSSPSTSSKSSRETGISRSVAWLRILGDLIMWKDVPRSALWFGAGSFSILSASFMKEMQLGIVSISANLALCYLAIVFFYRTFLSGSSAQSRSGQLKSSGVTEADFLGLIRFVLPTINLTLTKSGEVFSGDPAITLRVALVLWMVAKMGAGVSVWSFLRFGFFALFTIPKCQSCYSTQLYAFVQSLLLRGWMTWDSFTHKKAILIGGFIFAWNISSYSSRLWGGFILVVWFKLYQQSNPARFEKALADMGGSSAIDHIDRKKSLQHAMMVFQASQAVAVSEEISSTQSHPVQEFPGNTKGLSEDKKVDSAAFKA